METLSLLYSTWDAYSQVDEPPYAMSLSGF